MTPERLRQIHWTLVLVRQQRYQRPMDDGAQERHAVAMNATFATHVTEPALPPIAAFPSIAEVAVPTPLPAATKSPSTSATSPAGQILPGELSAGEGMSFEVRPSGPLTNASIGRLACLFRHWTWANEAMTQFERELAAGWDHDDDPLADHPFGAYYHWCALLCGFSEAALEHALLAESRLESLRADLEASLPGLRACRQLLVVIPASFEEHPRIVDLLHDHDTLGRLRRIHSAFGDALREEQRFRELEWLLYEH
jgi:hypothetical protein